MIEIMKYFPPEKNYYAKSIMNAHHTVREVVAKQYRNCNESKVSACDSVWEQIVLILWMGDTICVTVSKYEEEEVVFVFVFVFGEDVRRKNRF